MKSKRLTNPFPLNTLNRLCLGIAALVLLAMPALSQTIVYTNSLDSADNWNVNPGPGVTRATFGFDYGAIGIPPAPNSGGTTLGLKMEANPPGSAVFTGVSVSPTDQVFSNNYQLRFYLWQNYPGPLGVGGTGSTQLSGGGIGSSGARAQWPGGSYDSIFFMTSGDGGSGQDYRVYPVANNALPASGYYVAGTTLTPDVRNNSDPYYANFGGVAAPAAEVALYPALTGTNQLGAQGFAWHDVKITKIGNFVTWDIDNKRIATVDMSTVTGTLGGSNIVLNYSDINATTTTAAEEAMLFGLFDNVQVIQLPDSTLISARLMDPDTILTNEISEADASVVATFNLFTTTTTLSAPLTFNFTLTGTATRGDTVTGDYFIRTNGVAIATATNLTIPVGSTNILLEIVAKDDDISELRETIIFTLRSGVDYALNAPVGGTVFLGDNDAAAVDISAIVFNQAYEGNPLDFIRYRLERRGDTNAAFDVNLTYAGTATPNQDFTPVPTVTFNGGEITNIFDVLILTDATIEPRETVIVSVATGTGYTVGTNNVLTSGATGTLVDDDLPAENVLFSENFNTDNSANWKVLFGSRTPEIPNYNIRWAVDYASDFQVPAAPHSTNDTIGIVVTVNKSTELGPAGAAGVNLYPVGQTFSGDYALRFDMFLAQGTGSTTEHATFGINHDTLHTNWFHNLGTPAGWTFDGLWAQVVADSSALGDYILNSGPGNGTVPTSRGTRLASTLVNVFHNPPWTSGGGGGSPGNLVTSLNKNWAQVELSQSNNIVTLTINNTNILSYTNTAVATSGDVMLGYDDAFDSLGGGFVIYDNLRVVRLGSVAPTEMDIQSITLSGGNVQIDFTAGSSDTTANFKLASASVVTGPYSDDTTVGTTYSTVSAGVFRIVTPLGAGNKFFQIRRVP